MVLAALFTIGLVVAYTIVYCVSGGDSSSHLAAYASFMAPVFGTTVAFIGVVLTIRASARANDKAIERSEKSAERIQRTDKMPVLDIEVCGLDCKEGREESGHDSVVWVKLIGENPAKEVSLEVYRDVSFSGCYSLFYRKWLLSTEPFQIEEFTVWDLFEYLEEGDLSKVYRASDGELSFYCVLRYRDVLNNTYWQLYHGFASRHTDGHVVFLSPESEVYCERETSQTVLQGYFRQLVDDEREKYEPTRKIAEGNLQRWRAKIDHFDELSSKAHECSWRNTECAAKSLGRLYREKLGGGFGGGQPVCVRKFGRFLRFSFSYSCGFFDSGNEFNRTIVSWRIEVLMDVKTQRAVYAGKSLEKISPEPDPFEFLSYKARFFLESPHQASVGILMKRLLSLKKV